jgi:hypothetical protein
MPTYPGNSYEILSQVRYGINEFSDSYTQGTDTTGAFKNPELMRHINDAQYYLWAIVFKAFPELFLKSAPIAFSSSVANLPSDHFKIKEVSDADGHPLSPINANQRHVYGSGDASLYYRYGNVLHTDQDSLSFTGTLWYYSRCREIDTGMTSAGGALSATLATTSKAIADYYNNMLIENVTDSTVDTITDYSAARVCTVSNTWAASKYYGIVSDLPEIIQPLISQYAIMQAKKNPKSPAQVTPADIKLFDDMLREALRSFAGTQDGDVSMDDMINDF